jgi:arylsulfatase A-like enzyme
VSTKSRFNVVVFLGLLCLGLVIHDVASFRLAIILGNQPIGYALGRLPGNPAVFIGVGLIAVIGFLAVVWLANRRLSSAAGERRGRTIAVSIALLFLAVGCAVLLMNPRFPAPQEWSGLAAVIVGISMSLVATINSKRALAVGQLALLAATCVFLLLPQIVPGHREKSKTIGRLINIAMDDLDRRRRGWDLAEPDEIMADANFWASQYGVYRFDEHLQDVTDLKATRGDDSGGVLFEIPADGEFVAADPGGPKSTTSTSKQVFPDYRGGSILRTEKPLKINWSDVGAFHITMKVSHGSYFQVYWGETMGAKKNGIRIPLAPTGESASYVIKEKIIRYRGEGEVDFVWIIPSEHDARVEIVAFTIVDRANAVLRGAPFGVGYENIDDEIRRVIFVSTPCRLTYRVEVPRHDPRLLFGVSTLDGGTPTTFGVTVGHGDKEWKLFSKEWADESAWSDHALDMSPWAGKTVNVSFETSAPTPNLGLWSNPVLLGKPAPAPNVVVYLVDCLRADHLGAYGYERNTSPVFDSLSTRGTLFQRAYSNGPTTKLSVPSLLTSNPVSSTGVRYEPDVLPDAFPTLAEILRTMGYATTAFATNGNAGPYSGTHQGFSTLFGSKRIIREGGPDYDDSDAEILIGDLMRDWIRDNKNRNFFMYVHTMDAHGPYDPPESFRQYFESVESATPVGRNDVFDPPWVAAPTREGRIALYDGEIAYGDRHLGRFVDMLDEAGVLDNTIILFTADHGEYFGEHRLWGHVSPCFKQGTNIPLLIVGPGFPEGVRIGQNVQILDVLPTILDAVGFDPDPVLFQGESLVPLAQGCGSETFDTRTIFVEGGFPGELAFYCGDYHLVPEKNIIFDLSNDPGERVYLNRFALDFGLKSDARALSRHYNRTYEALNETMAPAGGNALEVDPETLRQLRALGYIE